MKQLVIRLLVASSVAAAGLPAQSGAADRRAVYTNEAARTASWHAGWSDALVSGDLVYVSGVVVSLGDGKTPLTTEQAFERGFAHLKRVLDTAGSSLNDVLEYTVYMTDIDAQLPVLDRVRLKNTQPPYAASTVVQVSRLAVPEGIAEIKVVARKSKRAGQ